MMQLHLDPATVGPMPGKLLVQITEVLGTMRRGVIRPAQGGYRKDTAYGRIVKMGESPRLNHYGGPAVSSNPSDKPPPQAWPPGYPGVGPGDLVVFPRDVELAWSFGDKRYALIHTHELLFRASDEEFEVLPWPERR